MSPCNPINRKIALIVFALSLFPGLKVSAQTGQQLFQSKCASCHNVFKDGAGPKLGGVLEKEKYGGDVAKIHHWVRNTNALVNSDPY